MRAKSVYLDYVEDILDSIESVAEFISGMSLDVFMDDKKTQFAVIRALEIIGEASKNIPSEVRNSYLEIPWNEMIGMRNKLIHEYTGVNLEVVWDTAKKDLLYCKKQFKGSVH